MKISFYEKVQIAAHIERKVDSLNIPCEKLKQKVCEDIGRQIKREYGLNERESELDRKYLADVHDLIDCYELPRFLWEQIKKCQIMKEETV